MRNIFLLAALVACKSEQELIDGEPAPPGLGVPPAEVDEIVVDRTIQVIQPVVDVLFVVDNSSSMFNEHQAIRTNFPMFVEHFVTAGVDYHIAMVSTDMFRAGHRGLLREGAGVSIIDSETEDPIDVFGAMTSSLGVHIGSIESGRAAAYTALELQAEHPRNAGFLRDDADLHMIFVSDDDDQSGNTPITQSEFLNWAENLQNEERSVTLHGIVTPSPACNNNFVSQAYLQYASQTGGVTYSICAADWEPALDAIGMAAVGLRQEYFLSRIPTFFPELLVEVTVKTVDENGQEVVLEFVECTNAEENPECEVIYVPGRNSVVFLDYVPDPLAEIVVTYTPPR